MPEAQAKNANKGLLIGIICGIAAIIAIVVIILIIVLSGGKKADLVGTWKLTLMKEGDTEYQVEQLEKLGFKGSITFKEDGTGTLKMPGSGTTSFEYDKDKMTMTAEGDTTDIKTSGSKIVIEEDSVRMEFEKE